MNFETIKRKLSADQIADNKQLPSHILAKQNSLPEKPAAVKLEGHYVRLEPFVVARDASPLFEISNGSAIQLGNRSIEPYDAEEWIWRYMIYGPFHDVDDFIAHLSPQMDASNGLSLCVFDVASGRQIGMTNFMNNLPAHLKIEVSGVWYSPIAQRTFANSESTYLMLEHAFALGYRRVEWKCHSHNQRSRKAALRMGFKFEGIQESHMIVKGQNRDTAWFRMLDCEWPSVKEQLKQQLYKH
jgi:RimJ/RimL family protein N-acetyltransferase